MERSPLEQLVVDMHTYEFEVAVKVRSFGVDADNAEARMRELLDMERVDILYVRGVKDLGPTFTS